MTNEERWRTESRPDSVLYHVQQYGRGLLTNRKTRLFGCGCFRLIWNRIHLKSIRDIVEIAEKRADRTIRQSQLHRSIAEGNPPPDSPDQTLRYYTSSLLTSRVTPGYIAWLTRTAVDPKLYPASSQWHECIEQATLARDIFGNPFRPVAFNPAWRTSAITAIATQMYESRDFSAMPILADALEDAGCENADVLDHCRNPEGVHVRGCWVVDLVLGKT